jgi:UDP-N-acetyl-D-mannosaminuronate dehydrogenase
VVGLGEVGNALSDVLKRTGRVLEHDADCRDFDEPIGVMHICVPFQRQSDFEATTISYIERFKPELTIINSSVLPGTTRAIAERTAVPIAYSPVRGKFAGMAAELLKYRKFVAGIDAGSATHAVGHFRGAGMATQTIDRLETLELAKLEETTYFGVLIAFAQQLNRFTNRVGGDYAQAAAFFEEIDFLPRARYFPGFIGGHCVIPNIELLRTIEPSSLLDAVLDSNRLRAEELAEEDKTTH